MSHQLLIDIICGETTCASEPEVFCRFLGTTRFGTVPICLLYRDESTKTGHTVLFEKDGWLQRCQSCLDKVDPGIHLRKQIV